jgi:hypothetical protein
MINAKFLVVLEQGFALKQRPLYQKSRENSRRNTVSVAVSKLPFFFTG